MLPPLSLVLGGAASGKSRWAEAQIRKTDARRLYIATAEAYDDEMRAKIASHQKARGADGWTTVEAPLNVTPALADAAPDQIVLLDCATLWLSNHMLADHDLAAEEEGLISALSGCAAPVVVVSNEVGLSVVPDNALARRFQRAQGDLNKRLAAEAGLVVQMIAGLPLVLKGALP
ncbi:bifunctional adenosylcobinamide kinase/adenosylcobinamide-phosphate guanylyltransferase [Roseovarius nanhaiticus]|uniref:Bifunctional adenosylcobalamin biosynthesis protein n=1 Tax=Roseovarius nanhaiticus TaxID=573024 RepID=A0A1N7EYA7_9RHOB|nr:bifunctional adenosylcobinamide kinase/adenosylcobinamide-phosphate guanylyltransferase [Roseovarius nanhaiticus]SEK64686.1 adenosylcobinamide kinase /adenosylcobinamide-phosphate guanylyltransferase [Roseovarius nanhaiticus]SIR92895.1 adenosylcobinamide kinase /adenosylcobinamide-phosphate guanylyltransferase [Roseovarius nanhaiticus]